jgi:hypothetical protein
MTNNVVKFPMNKERALKLLEQVEPAETLDDGRTVGFAVTPAQKEALEFLWRSGNKDEFLDSVN